MGGAVVRRGTDGQALWSRTLEGDLGGVRPPHILHDHQRVYVTHDDGVTALSIKTGAVLWHSPGPSERMHMAGDLLLATICGSGAASRRFGRLVTGRRTVDGREVFRARLPDSFRDPLPIWGFGGLFVVQEGRFSNHTRGGEAIIVDSRGRVRGRFERFVIDGLRIGSDIVLLMDGEVARLAPSGVRRWSFPSLAPGRGESSGGGLVPIPGGDIIEYEHAIDTDSGVGVRRFDRVHGTERWAARCRPLGVEHLMYKHHAYVDVEIGQAKVSSYGLGGTFFEWLDLATGRQVRRERK